MTRPLRLVVVGAGHLGKIHTRLATSLADVELVGIVDPIRSAAQSVAAEFGTTGFSELDQVLDLSDAAIVASPTTTHEQVALTLIERGIHVLIEKPLTDNVDGGKALVRAGETSGCVVQVGHVERFNPAFEIAQTKIHDAKFIEARRVGMHTFRSTDVGVVHDLMIHDIDLLLAMVASRPIDVQAFGVSVLGGFEDIAHATIRFENGCIANLVASRVSLAAERHMNVFTPTGFVGIDMQSCQVETVAVREPLRNGFDLSAIDPEERNSLKDVFFSNRMHHERPAVPERNAILEEQRDFVRCIQTGATPRVDGHAGVAALEVAEQVLQSIAMHRWDGTATGRMGPFGLSARSILRDPRLVPDVVDGIRRKAG